MIPDFKTYLKESVWNDMRKRSLGGEIKAEDDIITYDGQQMVEYIIYHYRINDNYEQPEYYKEDDTLGVSVLKWKSGKQLYQIDKVFYDYEYNVIYVSNLMFSDVYQKIKSNPSFVTEIYDKDYLSISPKKGDVNNIFLLEVVDFILDITTPTKYPIPDDFPMHIIDNKKKVYESVWNDMRKRSLGNSIKAEDDVNLLDCEEFCDYLKNRYECDMTKSYSGFSINKTNKGGFINIPLFVIPEKTFYDLGSFTYYTDEKCLAFGCSHTYYKMKCRKLLEEKCMTLDNITFDKRGYIKGDITNSLVIEFIDFILDNIKEPLIASIRRK